MVPRLRKIATMLLLSVSCAAMTATAQVPGEPLVIDDPLLAAIESEVRAGTPPSLAELRDPNSGFYPERGTCTVDGARVTLIENAARGVGIRGGYAAEATRTNDLLMANYRRALDTRYNFRSLMLQNGYIVPPAITRIRNVRQLSGPNYLYLTNGRATYNHRALVDGLPYPANPRRPAPGRHHHGDRRGAGDLAAGRRGRLE